MTRPDPDALAALDAAERTDATRRPLEHHPTAGRPSPQAVRRCPRCRDLIPGGPDGWARHAAGLDSAERLMVDGIEQARAEQRRHVPGADYVTRASTAAF